MSAERGILLDVSRLISRLGTGPLTGIDRVELEWLTHLQGRGHLLLCRAPGRQMLLPPEAGSQILRWLGGDLSDLPTPGFFARLAKRTGPADRAVASLSSLALMQERGIINAIGKRAAELLGPGTAYLNLGHANWRREVFGGLGDLRRVLLVHDVIPLDHPEFTRAGQSQKFRERFTLVAGLADLIVTISEASAERIELWRKRLAVHKRAPVVVIPIGTRLSPPDLAAVPADLDLTRPYFVTLGTIEPRKNHAVLLDGWSMLEPDTGQPQLFIIGRRGWENQDTFARLDALPKTGAIRELSGLSDGAVAALLEGTRGLLMPSRAEGFGLPLTEAAARGVPVLAAPLPSTKALLGDYPTYLDPDRPEDWAKHIRELADAPTAHLPPLPVPGWEEHFRALSDALLDRSD